MINILVVLLLPVAIALIICTGVLLAIRAQGSRAATTEIVSPWPQAGTRPEAASTRPSAAREHTARRIARFFLAVAVGVAALYGLMVLLGLLVIHDGPTIDKPLFHWILRHRIHAWHSAMERGTEVGDKYPVWAAAVTAAVCLAVMWRNNRWIPPVALITLIVTEHFLTLAINHTVTRIPPPGAGGIFPSGGTDRAVAIYGLIAYLIWRECSGRRRTAIIAAAVVAALAFEEGYSRFYLAVHWFTDIVGGFVYGCLLVGVFIVAVRLVAGPARVSAGITETGYAPELTARQDVPKVPT